LYACDDRPDTDVLIVNAPGGYLRGYNLKRDYDKDGNRNPDAKPIIKPASSLNDINKYACTDPKGLENLTVSVRILREELKNCRERKN
jgi:hypothetical protein